MIIELTKYGTKHLSLHIEYTRIRSSLLKITDNMLTMNARNCNKCK